MAAVPEAMALGLASARMVLPPEMRSSPAISFSLPRNLRLPEFSGLKIQQNSKCSPSLAMFNSGKSSRVPRRPRGGIVCEAQETAVDAAVPSVTDATWQSLVLKAEGPVLVEFWAPWCGPCRMMHPTISELANEYSGRLKCFKLNTDESPSIATQYGVRSIPTTMIFSNGEKKDTVIGAVPKTSLASNIQKFL